MAIDIVVSGVRPGGGSVALTSPDRVEIATVVWDDNSYDGQVEPAVDCLTSDYGDHLQLSRVLIELERMRSAGSAATVSDLRRALTSLSTDPTDAMVADARVQMTNASAVPTNETADVLRASLKAVARIALQDLATFESAPAGAGNFQAW
jgi:hypothetical protein